DARPGPNQWDHRRVRRLAVAAVAAVALAAAIATVPGKADARPDGPAAAAQALLDARVAAVASGHRAAWLAPVDPQAPAAFRAAQGRSYDGLRSLPLERFALTVRMDEDGDLAPGANLGSKYHAPVFLPETRETYRLRGYDDRDAVDVLWLTYVER